MRVVRILSVVFLVVFLSFAWGYFANQYKFFPHPELEPVISEISAFVSGHELEKQSTLLEKLQNDFASIPERELHEAKLNSGENLSEAIDQTGSLDPDYSQIKYSLQTAKLEDSHIAGFVFSTKLKQHQREEADEYLVVMDNQGNIIKLFNSKNTSSCQCQPGRVFKLHDIVKKDSETDTDIVQYNACGGVDWSFPAKYFFHHFKADSKENGSVWIWDGVDLVNYSERGDLVQRLPMTEIINANPALHIFESRLKMNREQRWVYGEADFSIKAGDKKYANVANADHDPFHPNDIDPLPHRYSDYYDMFQTGDLLVSFRSTNLLFVVRPETRKILWYAYGLTSRQHDPDWNNRGTITVFDNKFHNDYSVIAEIQPENNSLSFLVQPGDDFSFFKPTGGSHAVSEDGEIIFVGTDALAYGFDKDENAPRMMIVNQFKDGQFFEISVELLLDKYTLETLAKAFCS